MGNFLEKISANNIIKYNYKQIGFNEELGLVYKSNGTDYQLESIDSDVKYTIVGDTVKKIVESTGYTEEEIMDIIFIVYNAYESYKSYIELEEKFANDKKYLKKMQNNIVNVISSLISKYNYQDVYVYLSEMADLDLIKMFSDKTNMEEYNRAEDALSKENNKSYSGEEEEIVSIHFR